ncbi:MAG: hypothetical protein KC442_05535 [Thermomicrobiales bacterium]|nr:hypothetical protein [Thermomicrobiales bacterium]
MAGACKACAVTCGATDHTCAGTALQTALDGGGTVYVCPGVYTGNFTVGEDASVSIIGAGTSSDPATSTILKTPAGNPTNLVNLTVTKATSFSATRLRIEGNQEDTPANNSGVEIVDAKATFTNCDFSRFGPKYGTTGFQTQDSTVELIDCLLHNSANSNSGGVKVQGGLLTLNHTTIRDSFTTSQGGGIGLMAGTVTLTNGSLIRENGAGPQQGGGIYAEAGTTVNISADSSVVDNWDVNGQVSNCNGDGTFNGTCG